MDCFFITVKPTAKKERKEKKAVPIKSKPIETDNSSTTAIFNSRVAPYTILDNINADQEEVTEEKLNIDFGFDITKTGPDLPRNGIST